MGSRVNAVRSIQVFLRNFHQRAHCELGLKGKEEVQNARGRRTPDSLQAESRLTKTARLQTPARFHENGRVAQRAGPRAWRSERRAREDFSGLWNFVREFWLVFSQLDFPTAQGLELLCAFYFLPCQTGRLIAVILRLSHHCELGEDSR